MVLDCVCLMMGLTRNMQFPRILNLGCSNDFKIGVARKYQSRKEVKGHDVQALIFELPKPHLRVPERWSGTISSIRRRTNMMCRSPKKGVKASAKHSLLLIRVQR